LDKRFIDANELLEDSFRLAVKIFHSGFHPDLIIGVWRGGTPVAMAVHEYYEFKGIITDHVAIRASSYTGINERKKEVKVTGLEYVFANTGPDTRMLIVDDVFDSGNSFSAILTLLQEKYGDSIRHRARIACPWYKPGNNQTSLVPHYYLHETNNWLVFPHELTGLTNEEIRQGKPAIGRIII